LLHFPRFVESERRHRKIVSGAEPGELPLDGSEPRALYLDLRHHRSSLPNISQWVGGRNLAIHADQA